MSGSSGEQDAKTERRIRMATAALSLIYALWMLWMLIPEHRKRLTGMMLAEKARQIAGRAAYRTGHQAMAHEISGCGARYELPYALSLIRDKAADLYDRLRYIT